MKWSFALVLLFIPLCAFAQDSDIDQLKKQLEELKQLNAVYISKINEMEQRLTAIEQNKAPPPPVEPQVAAELPDQEQAVAKADEKEPFSTGFDTNKFDYYGYMRAGYGVDEDGTKQTRFQAPGAGVAYRLGNEVDTYMETGFSYYHVKDEEEDPPIFGTHFMLAYSTLDKNTGINLEGDSGTVSLRQAYATARNLIADQPEATLWAGQRFYRRHDIHINDFWWLDMSGYGVEPVTGFEL